MSMRKNSWKRIIVILTAFALVVSLLPANLAFAAKGFNYNPRLKYDDDNNCIRITWNIVKGEYYEVLYAKDKNGEPGKFNVFDTFYRDLDSEEDTPYSVYYYGPNSGKTYYFKVNIYTGYLEDSENMKKIGETKMVSHTVKLYEPSIAVYTDIASGDPIVEWEKVTRANEYKVYRATSKKGTYKRVATTSSRKYKDTKASNGKTYYYKVMATIKGVPSANSDYSKILSAKAAKPDKKLATAVKNTSKKKFSTLENAMSLISQTDVRKLTYFDGGLSLFIDGDMKLSEVYNFKKITAAGGTLKRPPWGGRGDAFMTAISVQPQKNGVKYSSYEIISYGVNIHKVKKGSTQKQTINSIKKTVNKYYPSSKWTVTVEKYNAKKHKGEISGIVDAYNGCLDKSSTYKKYKSNKYVLKIKNKANSKKQAWTFVTSVPTL